MLTPKQRETLQLLADKGPGFVTGGIGRSAHSLVNRGLAERVQAWDKKYCWAFRITEAGRAALADTGE
jgi:hypothetical protein